MDNLNYFTIGSIVALNFNTARVFQKFGIDFCCRGDLTITEACSVKNLNQQEHEAEGKRFVKISALSNRYTPPLDVCTTYRVTFEMLNDYEQDLHTHIHLENNILFPKAIELEQQLLS